MFLLAAEEQMLDHVLERRVDLHGTRGVADPSLSLEQSKRREVLRAGLWLDGPTAEETLHQFGAVD